MDGELAKEKLLDASGVRQARPHQAPVPEAAMKEHLAQMERVVQALMVDVKGAVDQATRAQERSEWMAEQLKLYCRETLPKEIHLAVDQAAQRGVQACLQPLETRTANACATLEELERGTAQISRTWLRDLMLGGFFYAVLTVLAMLLVIRFLFLGEAVNEAKRYELWGRKIQRVIESYPAMEKTRIYQWAGGKP